MHPPSIRLRVLALIADGSTIAEVAREVGVPFPTANVWARKAGIGLRAQWTQEYDEFVRAAAPLMLIEQVADVLGRSPAQVDRRARKLGVSFRGWRRGLRDYRPWTPAQDAALRAMAVSHTCREIAEAMGRSQASVNTRARDLRLSLRRGSHA